MWPDRIKPPPALPVTSLLRVPSSPTGPYRTLHPFVLPALLKSTYRLHSPSFEKDVKYLGVNFDPKITWRVHIKLIATKALRTFMRIYPLWKVSA
jgi:hypothetical protein